MINKSNLIIEKDFKVISDEKLLSNLKLQQLKQTCRELGITKYSKMKKKDLIDTLLNYKLRNRKAIIIQKTWKGYLTKKYLNLKTPKHVRLPKNRIICKNDCDFYSFDELGDIAFYQFITYEDENECLWGFDILSIYNYLKHTTQVRKTFKVNNPFTNIPFNDNFIERVNTIIRLSKLLKITINTEIEKTEQSEETVVNEKLMTILYHMEQQGYIIPKEWLEYHNKEQWINFLMDLRDLWQYRIKMPQDERIKLCSPTGNPFNCVSYIRELYEFDELYVKNKTYDIILNFISKGETQDMSALGVLYVLISMRRINTFIYREYFWLAL